MTTFNLSKHAKSVSPCGTKLACSVEKKSERTPLKLCPLCDGVGMEDAASPKMCRKCGGLGIIKEAGAKAPEMEKTSQEDYDREFFDAVCGELKKAGFEADHRWFDKYQGAYVTVNRRLRFWVADSYSSGDILDEDASKPYVEATLVRNDGVEYSATRGDYFTLNPGHVFEGFVLVLKKKDGTEERIENPKIEQLPDLLDVRRTFGYKPGTETKHYIFQEENNPDQTAEVVLDPNGKVNAGDLVELCGLLTRKTAMNSAIIKTAQTEPGRTDGTPNSPNLEQTDPDAFGAPSSDDIFRGSDEPDDFDSPDVLADRGEIWRDIIMMLRGSYEDLVEKLFDYLIKEKGLHVTKPADVMEMRTIIQKSIVNMSDQDMKDVFKFMKSNG